MNAPATGYYCVIQYCPDRSRLEAANVGVLLFSPAHEFLSSRLAQANDRIRRFFHEEAGDLGQINVLKRQLEHAIVAETPGIRTLLDLQAFAARFANELLITAPRALRVESPEIELAQLFDELVGGRVRRDPPIVPPVAEALRRRMEAPDLAGKVRKDVAFTVPVLGEADTADFAFQNGRLNLVQAKSFAQPRTADALREAYKTAVDGHLLFKQVTSDGAGLQLVIVGAFGEGAANLRRKIESMLAEHDVQFFGEDSLERLADRIRDTAH